MRLHRLEIRNFRKLKGPVVLDGLGEPLVVVAGDNEEGKSTVLHALKAALFEHHTVGGTVREEMAPYDGGTPEVALEFEIGGGRYRLAKAFKRGGISLEGPGGGRLSDDAAERRLQELLRFERRQGRSEPGPKFQGLQGLFWLDQGTSFAAGRDDPATAQHARDRLAAAIAGEVASAPDDGLGHQLLARVREQCARFWTEKRWAETGELAAAVQKVGALTGELADLQARLREAEDGIDRLARLRRERQRALDADELGEARARVAALRERLAGIGRLEEERGRARDRLLAADAAQDSAQRRHGARLERRRRLADIAGRRGGLEGEAAREAETLALAERDWREAEAREAAAASALERAEAEAARLEASLARARRLRERARLAAPLADARGAERAIREAGEEVAANPATRERLLAVLDAQRELQTAQAALEAAATRLEFRPEPGRGVARDGRRLDPGEPLRLTDRAELGLEGFGRLVVLPGGADTAERRARVAAADEALRRALSAAGVAELGQVRQRAEARGRAEARLNEAAAALGSALQAAGLPTVEALVQRLAAVELDLAREAGAVEDPAEGEELVEARLEAARRAVAERRRGLDAARSTARDAERRANAARQADAVARHKLAALAEQAGAEERALDAEAAAEPDAVLADAAARAGDARAVAAAAGEGLDRQLRLADPETVRERAAIAARAAEAAEADARRREEAIRDLEVSLRARGEEGIGERVAERAAELARAEADAARARLEAEAWKLLHEELAAADAARREALVEPVLARIRPWLSRLFPGAEPVLDGRSLSLVELRRGGVGEQLHRLSVGTREQLAVLVRLGLAQLLREREGEAPCLILDDALVYADEARFDTMKAILQRAAQEGQILILTCRPRDYRGLEARLVRLEGGTA